MSYSLYYPGVTLSDTQQYSFSPVLTLSSNSLSISGFPVMNDPLYNHTVFGPEKGKGGNIGKSDEKLIADLISIHNAENWLGMDGDSELSMFNKGDDGPGIDDIANKLLDRDQVSKKNEGNFYTTLTNYGSKKCF